MAVTRTSGSINPGQAAGFTIRVWTQNWSPAGQVTITLSGQPSPGFTTTACQRGTACTFPVPGLMPATLGVRLSATSKNTPPKAVSVTAAAQLSATKIKPLLVTQSIPLTGQGAAASTPYKPAILTPGLAGITLPGVTMPGATLPLGSFPNLTVPATSGSLVGAGSAAGLFPQITPGATSKQVPASRHATPHRAISLSPVSRPELTSQVIGLIALAAALLLAGLRLPFRRLPWKRR